MNRTAVEVADGTVAFVHPAGTTGQANATLVLDADTDTATVVDTLLLPSMAADLAGHLHARGRRATLVINTHPHVDHVGGNTVFTSAPVVAHPATAAMVGQMAAQVRADPSFLPRRFPAFADEIAALPILVPEATTPPAADLATDLRLLPAGPAHSPGDVAVWLPDRGVLITGDLCFNQVTPLALPGHANLGGWVAALDTLIALNPRVVVPGHGPVGAADTLLTTRGYLERLLRAARQVTEDGLDLDAAAALAHAPADGWAEPARTAINLRVAVDELTATPAAARRP